MSARAAAAVVVAAAVTDASRPSPQQLEVPGQYRVSREKVFERPEREKRPKRKLEQSHATRLGLLRCFDHFAVEYEYPGEVRVLSMCRQTAGATDNVSERVVGTKGQTYTDSADGSIKGENPWENAEASPNPYVVEHADLIASIRAGEPLNEGRRVAESTLTAIMGREAWTDAQAEWARAYFRDQVLPVLTPVGLDPAHPFPRVINKSLNFFFHRLLLLKVVTKIIKNQ